MMWHSNFFFKKKGRRTELHQPNTNGNVYILHDYIDNIVHKTREHSLPYNTYFCDQQ